jgi:hypothetical protein
MSSWRISPILKSFHAFLSANLCFRRLPLVPDSILRPTSFISSCHIVPLDCPTRFASFPPYASQNRSACGAPSAFLVVIPTINAVRSDLSPFSFRLSPARTPAIASSFQAPISSEEDYAFHQVHLRIFPRALACRFDASLHRPNSRRWQAGSRSLDSCRWWQAGSRSLDPRRWRQARSRSLDRDCFLRGLNRVLGRDAPHFSPNSC